MSAESRLSQVSLVLDRILLLIFFLAITISSLIILTSSPHLYESEVDPWGNEKPTKRNETELEMCRLLKEPKSQTEAVPKPEPAATTATLPKSGAQCPVNQDVAVLLVLLALPRILKLH